MKLVRLKIASPTDIENTFTARSAKQTAAWLEELPHGNADVCAGALLEALVALNRTIPRRASRYELMETLRPAVNDTCSGLVRRYTASSFPLSEGDQTLADRVRQLYAALATGYEIAVNEQLDAWDPARSNARLTLQLATQRALLCLGRVLLESYRVYAPEPPHLWRNAHSLYRNAEVAKLQALPIEGTRDADETALSIKQAYLRVTVLALTNPYHLMQGEAEELYRRIGRWVHFIQVRPPESGEDLAGNFMIDLGSDFPPRYQPRGVPQPPAAAPRLLEVGRLVDTLSTQIERSNESMSHARSASTLSQRMQRDMYIRFRNALGGRGERRSERRSTVARLVMVDGVSATHFIVSGRRSFTPEKSESAWNDRLEHTTPEDSGLKLLDDRELERARQADRPGRDSHFAAHDFESDDIWRRATLVDGGKAEDRRQRRVRYQPTTWHRKNESEGGLALFCAQQCPTQVRVGELVAYSDRDDPDPAAWRLGAIRWLRTRPARGLELGIKRLGKNGLALGTKAITGAGKGSEYLRGILVPRVNPLTGEATLLTPAAVYDVGSILRFNLGEVVLHARLTELIETTRQFSHFRFKLVDAPANMRATR